MKVKISFLFGITAGRWCKLLRSIRFRIAPRYLPRALLITVISFFNSFHYRREERRYSAALAEFKLEHPPIFIQGHWRSGTTHLHNMLAEDPQLATPNTYQAMFPHTFLTTEETLSRKFSRLIPAKRPQDNMPLGWEVPQEDEIAMCNYTRYSPALGFFFPQEEEHYDRYMTFRGVPAEEVEDWKQSYRHFVRKLTFKYQRPVVLKSPLHTCRIGVLLDLFPDARFVHIIRNPYRVFVSSVYLLETLQKSFLILQRPSRRDLTERVFEVYRSMHEAYFEEEGLIPQGQFYLMRHEDLEKDPMEETQRMYTALSLPGFQEFKPTLEGYIKGLTGYRKNVYQPLDPELKSRIATKWQRNFLEWGYPTD